MSARRWECADCGGRNVQISMPAWFYETDDYALELVEADTEASALSFYCEDCGDTVSVNDKGGRP